MIRPGVVLEVVQRAAHAGAPDAQPPVRDVLVHLPNRLQLDGHAACGAAEWR